MCVRYPDELRERRGSDIEVKNCTENLDCMLGLICCDKISPLGTTSFALRLHCHPTSILLFQCLLRGFSVKKPTLCNILLIFSALTMTALSLTMCSVKTLCRVRIHMRPHGLRWLLFHRSKGVLVQWWNYGEVDCLRSNVCASLKSMLPVTYHKKLKSIRFILSDIFCLFYLLMQRQFYGIQFLLGTVSTVWQNSNTVKIVKCK